MPEWFEIQSRYNAVVPVIGINDGALVGLKFLRNSIPPFVETFATSHTFPPTHLLREQRPTSKVPIDRL